MHRLLFGSTVCFAALTLTLALNPAPIRSQPAELSNESRISLITILPGDPVYTFAGHSAFRIQDPVHDLDRLYNYGTFSFSDPLFIPKFTYGHLRYFLSVTSYGPLLRAYERHRRPVIEQRLNLTHPQRSDLYRFLERNARPENRYYQYDFFFDNCSTRIRDALTETLGKNVDFSAAPAPNKSFRRLLDPYVASRPLLDLGFDLSLGLPADEKATAREAMFLPVHLMRAFDHATISASGTRRPLVARTDTVQRVSDYDALEPAFNWPLVASTLFLVFVLGWTSLQAMTGRAPTGRGDALLLAVVGLSGLLMCFLWFVSKYTVTAYNLNLVWAWPTHLIAAALLLRRQSTRGLRAYLAVTAAAAALFAIGWPLWPQNFHLVVLPFVLGVGVRVGWWALLHPARIDAASSRAVSPPLPSSLPLSE